MFYVFIVSHQAFLCVIFIGVALLCRRTTARKVTGKWIFFEKFVTRTVDFVFLALPFEIYSDNAYYVPDIEQDVRAITDMTGKQVRERIK